MSYLYLTWSLYIGGKSVAPTNEDIVLSMTGPSAMDIGKSIMGLTPLAGKLLDSDGNARSGVDVKLVLTRIQTEIDKNSK